MRKSKRYRLASPWWRHWRKSKCKSHLISDTFPPVLWLLHQQAISNASSGLNTYAANDRLHVIRQL